MEQPLRVCLIGSGNVATHLGTALSQVAKVVQIYSHSLQNATALAEQCGCESVTDSLSMITADADLYLVSVKDDAIASVVESTPQAQGGVWAHTSGSVPMTVFAGYKERYGVFYPLQTFSKDLKIKVREVPIFIEGYDASTTDFLLRLARRISDNVTEADSTLRKKLHVAAVFACNFVNLMWIEADELLKESGLGIEFLRPLLKETLGKLDRVSPADAQTGPACRGDRHVIDEHLNMLSDEKRELYSMLSEIIIKRYINE
ncbi:MAG: DUF2520 domain-containing protein [Bacteroidales bacterium]|nr:DUF2520 domain-containing protein [Bacteroidales bacterium]